MTLRKFLLSGVCHRVFWEDECGASIPTVGGCTLMMGQDMF